MRQLYIHLDSNIRVGSFVNAGQTLGTEQELGTRYNGITEHVHVEIWNDNGTINPWRTGGTTLDPESLIKN